MFRLTFDGDRVIDGGLVGHRDLDGRLLGRALLPDVDVAFVHAPDEQTVALLSEVSRGRNLGTRLITTSAAVLCFPWVLLSKVGCDTNRTHDP